jgi:hypothetical protein
MLSKRSTNAFIILNGEALFFKMYRQIKAAFNGNATLKDYTRIQRNLFLMLLIGDHHMVSGQVKPSLVLQQLQNGFIYQQIPFLSTMFSQDLKDNSLNRSLLTVAMISIAP